MHQKFTLEEALQTARDTRCVRLGAGCVEQTASVFKSLFGNHPAIVVADQNTFHAAGKQVAYQLRNAGIAGPEPFLFIDPKLYAEYGYVQALFNGLQHHSAIPVAVGAGTINDLTKLASHQLGRPYLCVATAASMDGYSAFGASITRDHSKQTFLCPAPAGVIADISIIRDAPGPMNSWGYADFIAKIPAGADWLLADALGVEPIDARAWAIVQGRLPHLLADPAGVSARDAGALHRLTEGLLLGGFAMQSTQSSRPASGAEHQFSHLWDMQHHTFNGRPPSHGFKVGIGTLAITALYEFLLQQPLDQFDVERCAAAWPSAEDWAARTRTLFEKSDLHAVAERETQAKNCSRENLARQLEKLRSAWPELKKKLTTQLFPFGKCRSLLLAAGAPVEPEQIGISRARLRESYQFAFHIRRRFTVLDLAVRLGLLEPALDHIFGPTGPWPIESPTSR